MSKLNVDQKTIFDLFSDKKADFLIPDYQRPYAWGEEQGSKSQYVLNYQFIQKRIDDFLQAFPSFFPYLPARILNNCQVEGDVPKILSY